MGANAGRLVNEMVGTSRNSFFYWEADVGCLRIKEKDKIVFQRWRVSGRLPGNTKGLLEDGGHELEVSSVSKFV